MTVYDEKDLSLLSGNLRGHYVGIAVGGGDLCKSGWGKGCLSFAVLCCQSHLFFGMGEPAFIWYGVIYLALGIGAMAISSIVRKKKK